MFPAVPPRLVDGSQFWPPSATLGPTRAGWPPRTAASASISNSPAGVGRYRLNLNKSKMPFSRSRTVSKWLEAEELAAFRCINSSISGGILSRNSDAQSAQGKGSLLINRLVRRVRGEMSFSRCVRLNIDHDLSKPSFACLHRHAFRKFKEPRVQVFRDPA